MKNANPLDPKTETLFKTKRKISNMSSMALIILLFVQTAHAQWRTRPSGLSVSQSGLYEMSASDQRNCYATVYDQTDFYNFQNKVVYTHDGGDTWSAVTIDSLEDNFIMDISASSGRVVHVIGWNSVTGGGNVFRSKDGGVTWQREAANAFTDPASYPDNILFFNPREGMVFGDPVGGCFEIYRTSNGGDTWARVPCSNIPAPMAPVEAGVNCMTDNFNSTIWATTIVFNSSGSTYGRLLRSDDKGLNWYVKCPSMQLDFTDGRLRFRNEQVGLYKNNGRLFRTTDGGATWSQVNYTGTWFSYDFDHVPGRPGVWISTGGDLNKPVQSLNGLGSSISYDDGDTWHTLDTAVDHTCIEMVNSAFGFGGGITSVNGNDGAFVYSIAKNNRATANTAFGSDLYVYPNPSNGKFTLKMKPMDVDATVEIYSMDGRMVYSKIVSANSTSNIIDLENPAPGFYQVLLASGVATSICKLIVQ